MASGVCPKCGWKAPAGLLKCPFCKTYIRKPGEGSSDEEEIAPPPPKPAKPDMDPTLPPPDATVVKRVKRELARELFDDSDKWDAFGPDEPGPDEKTDLGKI